MSWLDIAGSNSFAGTDAIGAASNAGTVIFSPKIVGGNWTGGISTNTDLTSRDNGVTATAEAIAATAKDGSSVPLNYAPSSPSNPFQTMTTAVSSLSGTTWILIGGVAAAVVFVGGLIAFLTGGKNRKRRK
ncbi:hypothetical protein [Geminisphaera colitermitum]|uniref:hypothetical protein n=1 Tax=Geminisphaera colitermitum TaxID=1148786 RepID=UPI000158D364|nr:hypothetical protein [Geminisphaera colitermitum]